MPGKRVKSQSAVVRTKASAKSRSGSGSRSRSPSAKKKGRKSAKSGKSKSRAKSAPGVLEGAEIKREPDMLDPIAMEHLYYTAHNAVTALELRGFRWEGASKKKGKKGKKKKK